MIPIPALLAHIKCHIGISITKNINAIIYRESDWSDCWQGHEYKDDDTHNKFAQNLLALLEVVY